MKKYAVYVSKYNEAPWEFRGEWEGGNAMRAIGNYKKNGERESWEIGLLDRTCHSPIYSVVGGNGRVEIPWFRVSKAG